jgi:DNA-binding transcriptional LysR family regulator
MHIDLQQLRHGLALAEHGSFVRAAAALHISQPALTRSIQTLERRFGSELFVRTRLRVVPTDEGLLYLERARELVRMADELGRDALAGSAARTGRAALGGGPFPAESFLPVAVTRYAKEFPRMSLQLRVGNWDELLQALRGRELDFFIAETSTLQRESDLEIARLRSTHPVWFVARAGHPLAGGGPFVPERLLEYPIVAPARVPPRLMTPFLELHRASLRQDPSLPPFPAIQCNAVAPAKLAALASDAITVSLLACVAAELETGQLVLIGTLPWMRLDYGIVSLRRRPWTQPATRLRELVIEAERDAARVEQRLNARFAPRPAKRARRGQAGSRLRAPGLSVGA